MDLLAKQGLDAVTNLRLKLFDVYDDKLSINEWCKMHKAINVSGLDINDELFPDNGYELNQNIAQHIFTMFLIYQRKNEKKNEHKFTDGKDIRGLISELSDSPYWNKVLIDGIDYRRECISDEYVLAKLGDEIWEVSNYKKNSSWLMSWCFRFSFAANGLKKLRIGSERIDIDQWVTLIYHTCAYKDRKLFDTVFEKLPSKLYKKITSLTVFNNILMTDLIESISTKIIRIKIVPFPWPHSDPMDKCSVLNLISCGIFPIRIPFPNTLSQNNVYEPGPMETFIDLAYAQMYVAPSICYFSPEPILGDITGIIRGMKLIWYIYNSFVIKCVDTMNQENWTESGTESRNYVDLLFDFVIKSMSPAYNSFLNVMHGHGHSSLHQRQKSFMNTCVNIVNMENDVISPLLSPVNQTPSPQTPSPVNQSILCPGSPDSPSILSTLSPDSPCILYLPSKYGNTKNIRKNPMIRTVPIIPMDSMSPMNLPRSIYQMNQKLGLVNPMSPMCSTFQINPMISPQRPSESQFDSLHCDFRKCMQQISMRDFLKQFIELSRRNSSCFRFENGTFMKFMPFRFSRWDPLISSDSNELSDYPFTVDQFTPKDHIIIKGKRVKRMYGMITPFTHTLSDTGMETQDEISFFVTNDILNEQKFEK